MPEKSLEKLQIAKTREEALKVYLELANLRYFNGQSDYLTVLDAEKSLFVTELETVNIQGELYLSYINLYKALGQGWEIGEAADGVSDRKEEKILHANP